MVLPRVPPGLLISCPSSGQTNEARRPCYLTISISVDEDRRIDPVRTLRRGAFESLADRGGARCARLARPLHQGHHPHPVGSGSLRQHRCVRRPRLPTGVAHLRARSRQGICGVRHGADLGLRAQQPRAPRSVDGGRARVSASRRSADRLRSRGAGGRVAARLAHASRLRPRGPDGRPLSARVGARDRRFAVCARRRARAGGPRLSRLLHGRHDLADGGRRRSEQGRRATSESVSARRAVALLLAAALADRRAVSPRAAADLDGAGAARQLGGARAGVRLVPVWLCPAMGGEPRCGGRRIARRSCVHEFRGLRAARLPVADGRALVDRDGPEHRRGDALVLPEPAD